MAADWFVCDVTLARIQTLCAKSPNHPAAQRYDGLLKVVTLQRFLKLIKQKSIVSVRTVAVYPQIKNPTYHYRLWKAGA